MSEDFLYVKGAESFCYICVYIDLFSRMVLSYGISDTIDSTLTMKTFDGAFQKRGYPKGLMVPRLSLGVTSAVSSFSKSLSPKSFTLI